MATGNTNYAQIIGIKSKWAPLIFAAIYFIVMVWYAVQALRKHGWIFGFLALFSAMRVVSFSLRAAMAYNHQKAAFNGAMAIAYEVIYNIGFFSILLSAHRLLSDRRRLAKVDKGRSRLHSSLSRFHNGRFIEILLLASIVLGCVGVAFALGTDEGRTEVGNKLGEASTYIFLATTVFIVIGLFLVIHIERSLRNKGPAGSGKSAVNASTHEHVILALVGLLLLLRILFYAVTIRQRATGKQTPGSAATSAVKQTPLSNEHLWYPLAALAELLVVLLFLVPALVPVRSLVNKHRRDRKNGHNNEKGAAYNGGDAAATNGFGGADHAHNGLSAV